jgi:hypothetical protein
MITRCARDPEEGALLNKIHQARGLFWIFYFTRLDHYALCA